VADSCEHGNEPLGSIKVGDFLTNWVTISFSRRTLFHEFHAVGLKHVSWAYRCGAIDKCYTAFLLL
jgi:hypothetical protein